MVASVGGLYLPQALPHPGSAGTRSPYLEPDGLAGAAPYLSEGQRFK